MSKSLDELEALLPCPFCNCTRLSHCDNGCGTRWVSCDGCAAEGPAYEGVSQAEAIAAWNRRDDAAARERDRLQADNAKMKVALLVSGAEKQAGDMERDRLREALHKIADAPAWGAPERFDVTPAEVRILARAALEASHDAR